MLWGRFDVRRQLHPLQWHTPTFLRSFAHLSLFFLYTANTIVRYQKNTILTVLTLATRMFVINEKLFLFAIVDRYSFAIVRKTFSYNQLVHMKLEFSEKNDRFNFFYLTLASDILPDV